MVFSMRARLCLVILLLGVWAKAQNHFRILDPQALSANGQGWFADPRTGALQLSVPVATVPGELPIPVVLRINGQFSSQVTQFRHYNAQTEAWVVDRSVAVNRPVFGTQNFGFIAAATTIDGVVGSRVYVLESGIKFVEEDLGSYSAWTADLNPVPSTFILAQAFGLSAKAAGDVRVTGDGGVAVYAASTSELGVWASRVGNLAPVGYSRPDSGTYQVVMDKDRARILQYYVEFDAWVPVLWVDRFNHWVSFQWTRKSSSLPSGVAAIHNVDVKNHRDKGVRLEWAQFAQPFPTIEQDLFRADMINLDAPSILVRGYPGWSTQKPAGFVGGTGTSTTYVGPSIPGPIGRPSRVQVGPATQVPAPSWQGSAAYMIVYPPAENPAPILQWALNYDASLAALTSLAEPNGTVTQFSRYQSYILDSNNTNADGTVVASTRVLALAETASTDTGGRMLRRDWTRSVSPSGEPIVVAREVFGDLTSAQRKLELTYAAVAESPHFGNGAVKQVRLLGADGTEWAKTQYSLAAAGIGGSLSSYSGTVTTRSGELTRTTVLALGYLNLQTTKMTTLVGPGNLKVLEELFTFETKKELLDIQRPTSVKSTRFTSSDTVLTPVKLIGSDYDSAGNLLRTYQDGGPLGKVGQGYSYDSEGRVLTESPYHSALPISTTKTNLYDPTTGNQVGLRLSFDGKVLEQALSSFDGFGRPRVTTDERGIRTTSAYDVRGRLLSSQRQGSSVVTYGYPDELTTTVTQDGLTTTTKKDGFGRVVSVEFPGGISEERGYDAHGRLNFRRKRTTLSLGNPSTWTCDPLDRLVRKVSETGTIHTFSYSVSGLSNVVAAAIEASGNTVTTKTFSDAFGQTIRAESPTGIVTTAGFDGVGNPLWVTQEKQGVGQTRGFSFDELGRCTQRTEPETGTTLIRDFNALGQPTSIVEDKDAAGTNRTRTLVYDGLGRMIRQSNPITGEYSSWGFDGTLLASQETRNADGTLVVQDFEYQGGEGKQLSLERTTMGGWTSVVKYAYEPNTGRLSALTYPSGAEVTYAFDGMGRINQILANGKVVVGNISFNEWGQRQRLTFGSGAYSEWSTKNGGTQLDQWSIGFTQGSLTDPGTPRRYNYDAAQRLLVQAGEWSLMHDQEDRVITASAPGLGITTDFDHDAFGNNTKSISTGSATGQVNNFNFGPQVGNQVPSLTSAGQATGWIYGVRGEASRVSRKADGVFQGVNWDGLGRLSSISESGATTTTTYAPSGLRVGQFVAGNPALSRRYAYTASGKLLSEFGTESFVAHGGSKAFRVGHNPKEFSAIARSLGTFQAGEKVTVTVWYIASPGVEGELFLGNVSGATPYDNSIQVTGIGNGGWKQLSLTWTMTHADEMWVYLYADQWVSTAPAHPGVVYDDLLVGGSLRGVVLNEGFEGQWPFGTWGAGLSNIGAVTTGDPNPLAWYRDVIYLGSEAIAEVDSTTIHELHNDHLGTPRIITKGIVGSIEGRQAYSAYGERILMEGYVPLIGFTGHVQTDASGLIYMRGRFFSPAWHVFLNSDQGVDSQSLNQRAYVGGNPFMGIDPTGLTTYRVHCQDGTVKEREIDAELTDQEKADLGAEMCGNGGGGTNDDDDDLGESPYPTPTPTPKAPNSKSGSNGPRQPQTKQPREPQKLNDCAMNCGGDAVMNAALGVYGSIPSPMAPVAATASLYVDLLGGGINPIGNAMGTSTYFTFSETGFPSSPSATSLGSSNLTVISHAGSVDWWMSARRVVGSAFGGGAMRSFFGRGEGNTIMGKSGLLGGKVIPIIGTALAIKGGMEFYKDCVKRCHDKFD